MSLHFPAKKKKNIKELKQNSSTNNHPRSNKYVHARTHSTAHTDCSFLLSFSFTTISIGYRKEYYDEGSPNSFSTVQEDSEPNVGPYFVVTRRGTRKETADVIASIKTGTIEKRSLTGRQKMSSS